MKTDPSFRLSPSQRQNAITGIDVDALERLAQRLPPESREMFLRSFVKPKPGELAVPPIVGMTTSDPELKQLMEEVWAPTWVARGLTAIEKSPDSLPGREVARARLKASMKPDSQTP